jgi:hypothetical protein
MPAILKSKKFQVFILGSFMVFLTQVVGLEPAEAESIRDTLVKMAGAYLLGQGVADHGKEAKKLETEAKPEA